MYQDIKDILNDLETSFKSCKLMGEYYKNKVMQARDCIIDFVSSEEFIKDDLEAIHYNYIELMNILKVPQSTIKVDKNV